MFYRLAMSVGQKKSSPTQEENLRPLDSALRHSITISII